MFIYRLNYMHVPTLLSGIRIKKYATLNYCPQGNEERGRGEIFIHPDLHVSWYLYAHTKDSAHNEIVQHSNKNMYSI